MARYQQRRRRRGGTGSGPVGVGRVSRAAGGGVSRAVCGGVSRAAGGGVLWAVVAATPFVLRALLLADGGATAVDLRGFASDAAVASCVFALLVFAARIARALAAALAFAWVGLNFVNAEMIRVLGAQASLTDLAYLGDPTFLMGSAVAISRPLLAACALALSLAAVWRWSREVAATRAAAALLLAAVLFGVHALLPGRDDVAAFRQVNFAHWNLAGLVSRSGVRANAPSVVDPRAAMRALDPQLRADVSGRERLPTAGRARNVLLVVLESVSGAYLEQVAAAHGRSAIAEMPKLDALAATGLRYDRFFTLQRKTNRGLYALLCGDLPNLAAGLPKMSAYPESGGHRCLPRLLREAGYRTAFVQAAPLGFMLKGQFMPRAGFEIVRGREWFERANARSVWGVDDRAFFERSRELVAELAEGESPWFITLLNVGTHHPYILPDDFEPGEPSRFERALAYLDIAFGAFVADLEAQGLLDDTLLLVVSDESMGVPGLFVDPWEKALTQNWGFLIARGPGIPSAAVAEPFSQLDVALSILDYLGLAGRAGDELFGRSVFRSYAEPRRLYFANTNLSAAGALDRDGALLVCLDDFARCRKWRPHGDATFASDSDPAVWDNSRDRFVQEMSLRSVRTPGSEQTARAFDLVGAARVRVDRIGTPEVIAGGQFVDLRAGDWVEVDLEVAVSASDPRARVQLTHVLQHEVRPAPLVEKIDLAAGEVLRLRYSFAPEAGVRELQSHSLAELLAGDAAELEFRRARMTLHRSGEAPGPGLVLSSRELVRE